MSRKINPNNEFIPSSEKKGNLNRRIVRVIALSLMALSGFLLISDYFATISHAEKLTLERLEGIVKSIAFQIDGDAHEIIETKYSEKDEITSPADDANYQHLHTLLRGHYESHDLHSPIYTFVKCKKGTKSLEFIGTSSPEPYFRHKYTSLPTEAYADLNSGGLIPMYKDEFGTWLSAYAPIKNSNGKTIAYVQADEKLDSFIAEVQIIALKNGLLSLLGLGVIIAFLLPYLKKILGKEEENKRLLESSLNKRQQLTARLEENELKLKENTEKLEMSNKDLTDFAHIASHDLKSPIRSIKSFSQLLLRKNKDKLDEASMEYLDFIISNSGRATQLIDSLLKYSTADKNLGEQKHFSFEVAVHSALSSLNGIISERDVTINIKDLPVIKGNQTIISQVLQNLINNGIKYNQSNQPSIEIGSGRDEENGTYFYIRDNGIGIEEKYQKDIFNMFTRLHSSKEYEGSGIGLAFCNRVVKAYNGKMWLTSNINEGSTFYFSLPNTLVAEEVMA